MRNTIQTILLMTFISFGFVACGENTENPVTSDIASIQLYDINTNGIIYPTDASKYLGATVTYTDGTSMDATDYVTWKNSNYDAVSITYGEVWGGPGNGGESNISIEYGDYNDSYRLKVYSLIEDSLIISSADINHTGIYPLEAQGSFIDLDTNATVDTNRTIVKNIYWSTTNDAIITINDDESVEVEIVNTGETNITATVFDFNVTKTYNIN